jgi:hypothetical protein
MDKNTVKFSNLADFVPKGSSENEASLEISASQELSCVTVGILLFFSARNIQPFGTDQVMIELM